MTGSVWQQSPMAESRTTQIASGTDRDEESMLTDECVARAGGTLILYDRQIAGQPQADWFNPENWPPLDSAGIRTGRSPPRLVTAAGAFWVLRHYRRGGFIARFVEDSYLWTGANRTRAFREWRLLARLIGFGLPVPHPVAARIVRSGLIYRADLITVRITDAVPLSTLVARRELDAATLRAVGRCIAGFHRAGVWHADLNAHNIQIDRQGRVYLLDFDRGRLLPSRAVWQRANMRRLQRSLRKIAAVSGGGVDTVWWSEIAAGYAT